MNDSTSAVWLPVVGYEWAYEVCSDGRIRSLDRAVPHWRGGVSKIRGRLLAQKYAPRTKYLYVSLCDGKRAKSFCAHAIVAAAFLGPRPTGMQIAHGDGDGTNNNISNLSYKTPAGNALDRDAHGRTCRGELNGCAILSAAQVRDLRAATGTHRELAARFGISATQVGYIKSRKSWRCVP